MTEDFEKAFEAALRILKNRPHSEAELKRKLCSRGYSNLTAGKVIDECRRYKYIDDPVFAGIYAEELKKKGRGIYFICAKLREKGIASELIESIARGADADAELSRAKLVLDQKMRSLAREGDSRKKREKLYRFMISRGFSSAIISRLFSAQEL